MRNTWFSLTMAILSAGATIIEGNMYWRMWYVACTLWFAFGTGVNSVDDEIESKGSVDAA